MNWQYSPLKLYPPPLMQVWSAVSASCAMGYELPCRLGSPEQSSLS